MPYARSLWHPDPSVATACQAWDRRYPRTGVAKVKVLLITVDESCSIVAGSGEMGMVFGGRSRYAVPGIDGKPGVPVVAVTRTAGVTGTWSRRSRPRARAFQKVNVQVVLAPRFIIG